MAPYSLVAVYGRSVLIREAGEFSQTPAHFHQIILRYFGKTANLTVSATRNSNLTWPYVPYSDRIIVEKVFGKDIEGGGLGTISFIIPAITRKEWAKWRN